MRNRSLRKTRFTLLCVVITSILTYTLHEYRSSSSRSGSREFVIQPGESLDRIATRLEKQHFIVSAGYFSMLARIIGRDRQIQSGTFVLESDLRAIDILNTINEKPVVHSHKITFPEGLNRWQIADKMAHHGWSRDHVLTLIDGHQLEGKLFPDTYLYEKGSAAKELLFRMHQRFEKVWQKLLSKYPKPSNFSEDELITLASLVEKEMVNTDEASLIARVFVNRLLVNMKLQSDPTYVYSADRYGQKPTRADRLKQGNPYNTDRIKGLPPGPIANPGKTAMKAALRPDESADSKKLFYFVAKQDGSGTHYFSKSYSEHKDAIQKYLKRPKRLKREHKRTPRSEGVR